MTFRFGSPWIGFKAARPWSALIASFVVLTISSGLSLRYDAWAWLVAGGGLISFFGVLMTFPRLLRVGPAPLEDELPPTTLRGKPGDRGVQLNMAYLAERASALQMPTEVSVVAKPRSRRHEAGTSSDVLGYAVSRRVFDPRAGV